LPSQKSAKVTHLKRFIQDTISCFVWREIGDERGDKRGYHYAAHWNELRPHNRVRQKSVQECGEATGLNGWNPGIGVCVCVCERERERAKPSVREGRSSALTAFHRPTAASRRLSTRTKSSTQPALPPILRDSLLHFHSSSFSSLLVFQ
jgi:hypothetical protein